MDDKIDKRTREYKERAKPVGVYDAKMCPPGTVYPQPGGPKCSSDGAVPPPEPPNVGLQNPLESPENPPVKPGCHKCGKQEDLIEVSPQISLCSSCVDELSSARLPVKRSHRGKPDYANLTKCGADFSKCMKCGEDLPPNEFGSTAFRKVPECCDDCVRDNYGRAVIGGKEINIDPTDPPKPHFNDDGSVTYKDSKGKVYK